VNAHAQPKAVIEQRRQTTQSQQPIVLPMLRSDLDIVCRIASESFPTPWTQTVFESELTRDWAQIRVLRSGKGERICGFINFWIIGDEVHLHNLAVLPAMRRRGYARTLVLDMFEIARNRSATTIFLEVRRSNQAAINLYKSVGFVSVAIRPRYYSDNQEDAMIMRSEISAVTNALTPLPDRDESIDEIPFRKASRTRL
jgi:ribosomal-protein-alanine N-acetyltransferase